MAEDWRNREINLHKEYVWLLRVTRGAVLLGIGILIGMAFYADPASRQAYAINVFTSVLSLGATALIFDELNRKRSRDELKRQLVDDTASRSNEIARNAVHQLGRKGWLEGENGLLKGADLQGANWQGIAFDKFDKQGTKASFAKVNLRGANLRAANLQGADLSFANLEGANLIGAKLKGASLNGVNLRGANLSRADLEDASLIEVNLREAKLWDADLRDASLPAAKLQGASFSGAVLARVSFFNAIFSTSTKLPDDDNWSLETDIRRFTDPDYPYFWEPYSGWETDELE